ncbi:MAG: hybrid sensor histidine kinase/response regulator [Burkholderiales bacterium]|nr:hybrid sensor histidine kinase/response regulator [Burkholderiales bacterium]
MNAVPAYAQAETILYVDDEPQACKWFQRAFSDEFRIVTAPSVAEALLRLTQPGADIAVLAADYRMPGRNGLELMAQAQREHRAIVRLLVTAYAEKDMAIAAVNQGQVFRILEKPLDPAQTREALREALARHRSQALAQALHEGRALAVRETLGFLAHELNTPLTTVRGYMTALRERHQPDGDTPGLARFSEGRPGEVLSALEAAERNALYCQSLVSTFVKSAREAHPGLVAQGVTAADLVGALLREYPFEDGERDWVQTDLRADFALPGQRDLLFLVVSTLTKNALQALRGQTAPQLRISLSREAADGQGAPRPCLRVADNGPGIAPDLLRRLTHEAVTTRAGSGGNGMGLLFCRRVLQSLGGGIAIESVPGQGCTVSLLFQPA